MIVSLTNLITTIPINCSCVFLNADADEPGLMDDEGDGRYLAPEALNGVITELADVFAIGCTVAQMALGLIRPKHRNYGDNWLELKTEPNSWTANESLARDIRSK